MSSRISPLLAVIYLDRIERRSLVTGILFYKRYIDDVFVIGSTAFDLHTMVENLNSCDPNIRFTVESPDDSGSSPYLNTKVRICNGTTQFLWYKKPIPKNILLHSRSAHPLYMKATVVRNLIITKKKTCNRVFARGGREHRANIGRKRLQDIHPSSWHPSFVTGGVPLVLPYVNEHTARDVSRVVKASMLPIKLIF
ncbi:hypothetical protein Y032_0133g1796 [Ancylostoma ceylanicum]|uniref:Reverse transcriptase domain-containing protein n=1 Tax=Ancylostoma ceylanicum TaxID=53326 RepID=A0A016T6E8_9BILA|nr:hypothetical protein Y032_0133g1796 [Ancylostoma ceylanicum]